MTERGRRPTGLEVAPQSAPIGPEEEEMRLRLNVATLAVAMPCLAIAACGQVPPEPTPENRTSPAAHPDPRVAAHRQGAEAIERQLAPMLSRASGDLVAKSSPRGGAVVDLAGRFQHVAIARQKADGTIDRSCLTTTEELSALLRSASEAP
jgi:hypothetical protein